MVNPGEYTGAAPANPVATIGGSGNGALTLNLTFGVVELRLPAGGTSGLAGEARSVLANDATDNDFDGRTDEQGVTAVTGVVVGGAGYQIGDVITALGGTFASQATLRVSTIGAGMISASSSRIRWPGSGLGRPIAS